MQCDNVVAQGSGWELNIAWGNAKCYTVSSKFLQHVNFMDCLITEATTKVESVKFYLVAKHLTWTCVSRYSYLHPVQAQG